jgi:hypothetical protein
MRWAVVLLICALASPTLASPGKARRLKAAADRAFVEGDYRRALSKLEAAYAADPQPGLLANQALVLEKIERYADAVVLMRRFLESGPGPAKAQAGESVLERLQPWVQVRLKAPGARVALDGVDQGPAPARFRVVAGTHVISAAAPEHAEVQRTVMVRPAQPLEIDLKLRRTSRAPVRGRATPETVVLPAERGGPDRLWAYVAFGTAGAAALGAGVLYGLTAGAVGARDEAGTGVEWDDQQASADGLYSGFWIASGVAAAAAGVGVALWVLSDDGAATVQASAGPSGFVLSGRF